MSGYPNRKCEVCKKGSDTQISTWDPYYKDYYNFRYYCNEHRPVTDEDWWKKPRSWKEWKSDWRRWYKRWFTKHYKWSDET